jgi:hypothetical protein
MCAACSTEAPVFVMLVQQRHQYVCCLFNRGTSICEYMKANTVLIASSPKQFLIESARSPDTSKCTLVMSIIKLNQRAQ